jgi:hypothetical protein
MDEILLQGNGIPSRLKVLEIDHAILQSKMRPFKLSKPMEDLVLFVWSPCCVQLACMDM